jgi:hypothetical protein
MNRGPYELPAEPRLAARLIIINDGTESSVQLLGSISEVLDGARAICSGVATTADIEAMLAIHGRLAEGNLGPFELIAWGRPDPWAGNCLVLKGRWAYYQGEPRITVRLWLVPPESDSAPPVVTLSGPARATLWCIGHRTSQHGVLPSDLLARYPTVARQRVSTLDFPASDGTKVVVAIRRLRAR